MSIHGSSPIPCPPCFMFDGTTYPSPAPSTRFSSPIMSRARELTLSLEDSANLFMGMLMYRKSDA
jgi:hypothetical protein